jgi:hypothetical protein
VHVVNPKADYKTCCGLGINEKLEPTGIYEYPCDKCVGMYNAYHRPLDEPKLKTWFLWSREKK